MRAADAVAGLDATEQGRPIYLPLGFRDLYPIARWHFDGVKGAVVAPPAGVTVRPSTPGDLPRLAVYDRPATGMERPSILMHLALRQPGRAWLAEDVGGKIVGFVLGREGRVATSLGPVVADREAIAIGQPLGGDPFAVDPGAIGRAEVFDGRDQARGLTMTYEPTYLRFFQARFEPR